MFKSANKKIAVFLAISAFSYIIASIRLPAYPYVPVDSDAVPISLGFILLILSILLFFVKDNHQKGQKTPEEGNRRHPDRTRFCPCLYHAI